MMSRTKPTLSQTATAKLFEITKHATQMMKRPSDVGDKFAQALYLVVNLVVSIMFNTHKLTTNFAICNANEIM